MPVRRVKSIVARCPAEPSEEIANSQSCGFAFAAASISPMSFCGREPVMTQTSGATAVRAITSRSTSGSNVAPLITIGITAVLKALASSV